MLLAKLIVIFQILHSLLSYRFTAPTNTMTNSMSQNPPNDYTLQLYKMEYERAAERYQNIYKAVWENFSYIAVISGAILTFGSTKLDYNHAALIACVPLIFWFWSTFTPLDIYGDGVNKRLKRIEEILNGVYKVELDHFTKYYETRHGTTPDKQEPNDQKLRFRTTYVVRFFFLLLHLIALLLMYRVYFPTWPHYPVYIASGVMAAGFTLLIMWAIKWKLKKGWIVFWFFITFLFSIGFVWICLSVVEPAPKPDTKNISINLNGRMSVTEPLGDGR